MVNTEELIVLYAISRGGSTATGNWLLAQHIDFDEKDETGEEFLCIQTLPHERYATSTFNSKLHGQNLKRLVVIYEQGPHFGQLASQLIERFIKYKELKTAISLRDARNWLASCIKSNYVGEHLVHDWKELAKKYIAGEHVNIFYDKWFSDIEYRKGKCQELGLDFTDFNLRIRHSRSGFSHGREGDAQKLDVLNRYQEVQQEKFYKEQYNNLREYNEKILAKENWKHD